MPHVEGPAKSIYNQTPNSETYIEADTVGFATPYQTITDTPFFSWYVKNNSTDKFLVLTQVIASINPAHISNIDPAVDFQVIFAGTPPTTNITTSSLISTKSALISVIPATLYLWDGNGAGMTGETGNINGGQFTMTANNSTYQWDGITSIAPGSTLGVKVVKRVGSPDVLWSVVILASWASL